MEKSRKYTREELLKIVLEKLSYASKFNEYEKNDTKIISPAGNNALDKEVLEEKINDLIKLFEEIGYGFEYRRLENIYNKFAYNSDAHTPIYRYLLEDEDHALNYELFLKRCSNLIRDFLDIISNEKIYKEFDEKQIESFVPRYLSGFVFDSDFISQSRGTLNEVAMSYIVVIYNFYGISLTDADRRKIIELHLKDQISFNEKKALNYDVAEIYKPELISKYIVNDIKNKLALADKLKKDHKEINLEEEKDDVENLDVNFSELSLDEKINFIKQKVAELEELSAKEKELTEALTKILSDKERVKEEINSFKL